MDVRLIQALRVLAVTVWLAAVVAAMYLYVFHRSLVDAHLRTAFSSSAVMASILYLLLGSLRGFTLLPATSLIVAAIAFFPPGVLLLLTLAGILISSASIYFFSEALGLDRLLAAKHPATIARLKAALQAHEMSIIIGWSFFPLAPTDLIVYVCGVLRVDVKRCLLGVLIGEGGICAIYIFFGDTLLRLVHLRG